MAGISFAFTVVAGDDAENSGATTISVGKINSTPAVFALAINSITGYIPTMIKAEGLPLERQDIFGTIFEHKEEPKKKIIPIKVVSEKVGQLDGVEVYGKSYIESN